MSKNTILSLESFNQGHILAVMTCLVEQKIPFAYEDKKIVVAVQFAEALKEAVNRVAAVIATCMEVVTDADSEEQMGSYTNGTLSHIAPGVALTVQVHPAKPRQQNAEVLAQHLPEMFYSLLVQGWEVTLVLGDDKDNPHPLI